MIGSTTGSTTAATNGAGTGQPVPSAQSASGDAGSVSAEGVIAHLQASIGQMAVQLAVKDVMIEQLRTLAAGAGQAEPVQGTTPPPAGL